MQNKLLFSLCFFVFLLAAYNFAAGQPLDKSVMSEAYWKLWNDDVQKKMDDDIEQYRKGDAEIKLENTAANTEVNVEQLTHAFLFGGNIFLYGYFDTPEKNKKYEDIFGNLFNSATVPFYWKTLEPERGKPRYAADSPYIYRRPATDPVVDFCEAKGLNMNGHAIIYGMRRWGHPEWMPDDRKEMEAIFEQHVKELAERYKGRIQMWDVVNESIDQANRGIMPDDYSYKTYKWAMRYFPDTVQLNTNDCDFHGDLGYFRRYAEIVRNLIDRGIRVDNTGAQMHIFNPKEADLIAAGNAILTPEKIYGIMKVLDTTERPIHISEITVSVADNTEKSQNIQAILTRNFYRLWFSYPTVMGITWWNSVDGGAAPGEPAFSGLYDKDLNPKLAYHELDRLINKEWKTNLKVRTDSNGAVKFRGFKGKYKITWTDKNGKSQSKELTVK
ncbi:MAG: endo-1,4-beta-xylanase [Planctomycetaceae bacterium]|nr:endo-1,4-beta-xylanase [Planctomycetaceae bacterium]